MSEIHDIKPIDHQSPLCVRCERQPGTIEDAEGEYICLDCHTKQMDMDYEREREREREQGLDNTHTQQGEPHG